MPLPHYRTQNICRAVPQKSDSAPTHIACLSDTAPQWRSTRRRARTHGRSSHRPSPCIRTAQTCTRTAQAA